MNVVPVTSHLFSRQSLSPLGRTSVAALLGMTILCGIMSLFSFALLITTVIMLLCTLLVAFGIRWAPLLGSLLSGYILYVFLIQESFPVYHLVHPKDALSNVTISFGLFVIILLILAFAVVALGAGVAATVQNYRRRERQAPRWLSPSLTAIGGMVVGAILIAALSQPGVTTTTTGGEPTIQVVSASLRLPYPKARSSCWLTTAHLLIFSQTVRGRTVSPNMSLSWAHP